MYILLYITCSPITKKFQSQNVFWLHNWDNAEMAQQSFILMNLNGIFILYTVCVSLYHYALLMFMSNDKAWKHLSALFSSLIIKEEGSVWEKVRGFAALQTELLYFLS